MARERSKCQVNEPQSGSLGKEPVKRLTGWGCIIGRHVNCNRSTCHQVGTVCTSVHAAGSLGGEMGGHALQRGVESGLEWNTLTQAEIQSVSKCSSAIDER